jgi:DNA-directed RNA polymerase alpha subunit
MEYERTREISVNFSFDDIIKIFSRGLNSNLIEKLEFNCYKFDSSEPRIIIKGEDVTDEENEVLKKYFDCLLPEVSIHSKEDEQLNIIVYDLDLSVKCNNLFKFLEIVTLKDLISYSKNELLGCPNFGKVSLMKIKDLLKERNLSFKKG